MKQIFWSLALIALPFVASAQDAPGRYQIASTPSGVVRLDTQTGAMTLCRDEGDLLTCDGAAAVRNIKPEEVKALENRIAALEKALKDSQIPQKSALPDQAEIDRSLSIMEQMMRRFMGLAEEFSRERPRNDAYPNKT